MATKKKTAEKVGAQAGAPRKSSRAAAATATDTATPSVSSSVTQEHTKMVDETLATAPAAGQENRPQIRVAVSPSLGENVVYADGVQSLSIRGGVGHFDLFQILGADKNGEQRMITHRLVVPIAALNEMLQMLAAAANATRERAQQAVDAPAK
jgi:hypothetical protein